MKETKLEIPADCEVDKIETQEGHIVVTFKEKERKLPKSWEEFCKTHPIKENEVFLSLGGEIINYSLEDDEIIERRPKKDLNTLPDRATAEAVLALCQLIQLRNAYNGDWVPDWNGKTDKYFIDFIHNEIHKPNYSHYTTSPLYFETEELRDEFLRNFRPLIEKLKPLYGIKLDSQQ